MCADIQMTGVSQGASQGFSQSTPKGTPQTVSQTVSQTLATSLVSLRPQIVSHACRSAGAGYFGERLVGALLPHAVEHIAIDILVERYAEPVLTEPAYTRAAHTEPKRDERPGLEGGSGFEGSPGFEGGPGLENDSFLEDSHKQDMPVSQTFAGTTVWLDRADRTMRVRVGCTSDDPSAYLEATRAALIEAVRLMNQLLAEDAHIK